MSADVVDLARGWIGTPYHHQGSQKGVGTDCLGLIRGVWRELHGEEPECPPAYTPDWGECGGRELLFGAAMRHLVSVPKAEIGSGHVLVFRMQRGAIAKHLGIVSADAPEMRFIHAYSGHGVIENALSAAWRRKIAGVFAFPDGV